MNSFFYFLLFLFIVFIVASIVGAAVSVSRKAYDHVDVRNSDLSKQEAKSMLDTAYAMIIKYDRHASNNAFNHSTFVRNSQRILEVANELDKAMKQHGVTYSVDTTVQYFINEARKVVDENNQILTEEKAEHALEKAGSLEESFYEAFERFECWLDYIDTLKGRLSYFRSLTYQRYEKYNSFVQSSQIPNELDKVLSQSCETVLSKHLSGKDALKALLDYYESQFRAEVERLKMEKRQKEQDFKHVSY